MSFSIQAQDSQKVYTTYLWHMDQPVYWGEKSKNKPDSKQFVEESHRLKTSGENMYPGSNLPHPTNDLQEIFSKDDRVNAYQSAPRNAINSITDVPDAGAQLSISAGLLENIQSLAVKNQWGYGSGWMNGYKEVINKKTSGGYPRLDVVSFTYDHALSPLVSERTLKKQILGQQYVSQKYYGYTSPGYWPAECAFSERIIKTLVECDIQWSVVANSHLARTLSDYAHPYNINGNIDAPNKADMTPAQGINWFDGAIDGRGSRLAAPYCYQAHKARYVDPSTGTEYKIDVIPMCNYLSYIDGYSGANVNDIQSKIAPYCTESKPSIVLLAHDGDNAWGGGYSYYNEAVTSFTHAAKNAGYKPTTIQQFLKDHPVPENDVVRVEDGAWVNADSDWGHPQFINWLWPLYNKSNYTFNPDGWTEDARNWAVITATENYVTMAEDLTGNLSIEKICEGGSIANDAEKAWHFYFGGLNSGFMYYGKAEDMEVKPSMTGNIAIEYAQKVINAKSGTDNTAPSVFIPQRYPYNPGGTGFGPTTSYKKVQYPSDFTVWTFAYDVSGLSSVKLKYRTDKDGVRSLASKDNETYAGGVEVNGWQEKEMNRKPMAADPANDSELNFFILPKAKADLCYADIAGLSETLVDYYVEATDTKGNVFKTPIQHVYIGAQTEEGQGTHTLPSYIEISPANPACNDVITIVMKSGWTAGKNFYWGKNSTFTNPTTTPFVLENDRYVAKIGPFDQSVNQIKFCINTNGGDWDNNNGNDYVILLSSGATNLSGATDFQLSMIVYPSPMQEQCMISLPNTGDHSYTLSIYDLSGKKVTSEQFEGNDYILQRKNLKSGTYLLKISPRNGGSPVYQTKLIIK
ncbi:MAG: T9SS type A sorting domain-containing protein [Bacteroidales bacterium]|nr:T9SS type A sorting domain-containing protein [Bacteroidales bacterium]